MIPLLILWVSLGLILYCYGVYPLLVIVLARWFPDPVRRGESTPPVSILIPAYNEEKVIAGKIQNTLSLDYPASLREIVVVSDGSSDATEEIARRYEGRGVKLLAHGQRRGKMRALLDAVAAAHGDILVFSDASGMLRPDALREMAANFADSRVGCVCGYYRSPGLARSGRRGESIYWEYEFAIKRAQSRLGTLLGATGALYAVRRELFTAPPPDTINDDFVIPALVVCRGYRAVLEERAVVDDLDPCMGDFRSRVRVAAGNWQQLLYARGLLSPRRPLLLWQCVSHKLIRMLVPLLLLAAIACAVPRAPWVTIPVALVLLAALIPCNKGRCGIACSAARKFIEGSAAGLCGMLLFFSGRAGRAWR